MRIKRLYLIAVATVFLLCISSLPIAVDAAEVWSDNFDDEVLDGWTIFAYENITIGPIIDGNFSADGGRLTSMDDDINIARHNSTTNVGTWSFDMYVPNKPNADVGMTFMANDSRPLAYASRAMTVHAWTAGNRFLIWEIRDLEIIHFESPYFPAEGVIGWHHIDITRTDTGQIRVFFNGTMEWDFVSNDVTSSTYLALNAFGAEGAIFDNILVSDTIDVPTTTTTTTAAPIPLELIVIGVGVVIIVLVIVYWIKFKK